ncbi:hypothetical protein GH714_032371 [Hevea brasiliensis]|uniref:Leucine-rich repeat-containing N-terminal plant-type domain-containing protein n=1 Tax=Hevea brasiliensis TaxID=3981 RepID=A0A6A6NK90_HEVBR|nr:hypothetical protein GH714_032371 [Hevea brasiliensis]
MKREWRRVSSQDQGIMGIFVFGYILLLLLIIPSQARELASQQSSNDDTVGLLTFKRSSVQSDPKNVLANWTTDSPSPCSWFGVSCSLDGRRVTSLNLTNAGLIGSLHLADLTSLPALTDLILRGNLFSAGDLSASSATPCALETIDLSFNNISDPLPGRSFLFSCNRLARVNLSHNSIPGGTVQFGPSLLELDLYGNRISDSTFLNRSLSICQNLNFLNFSNNKLAGKLETTPISCKSLSVLDLSYNLLSGEIPPSFVADSPPSLKHLDLSHNNFSGNLSSLDFGRCSNLSLFSLSQNRLSGTVFPISLNNCEVLETLDLSHNELQLKIPGAALGRFKKLKQLSLADNLFFGDIPPELGQACGTLQELDLSANKLTGGLPLNFVSCSSLQTLNLGNNLLSGDFLTTVISSLQSLKYLYVHSTT